MEVALPLLVLPASRNAGMSLTLTHVTYVIVGWPGAWGVAVLAAWALDIACALRPEASGKRRAGTAAGGGLTGHDQVLTGELAHRTTRI